MSAGFKVVQSSLVCLWDEMLGMVGANLIWFLASLPFFAAFWLVLPRPWAITLSFLFVIVPNPLTAGVHLLAHHAVQGESGEFSLAWQGMTRNLGKTLIVLAIDCIFLAIIVVNLGFYLSGTVPLTQAVGLLWLAILVFWLAIQVYLYPFLLIRPDKGSWSLFRDSFFLVLANPVFTMTVLAFVLFTILLSVMLGLAVPLLVMALVALFENQAMAVIAEKYTGQKVTQNGTAK